MLGFGDSCYLRLDAATTVLLQPSVSVGALRLVGAQRLAMIPQFVCYPHHLEKKDIVRSLFPIPYSLLSSAKRRAGHFFPRPVTSPKTSHRYRSRAFLLKRHHVCVLFIAAPNPNVPRRLVHCMYLCPPSLDHSLAPHDVVWLHTITSRHVSLAYHATPPNRERPALRHPLRFENRTASNWTPVHQQLGC